MHDHQQVENAPENTGFCSEDGAEDLGTDEDWDIIHAVRVIAAVQHP